MSPIGSTLPDERLETFKILISGVYAAGKTSLIESVSQTKVISTDVATSGTESIVKSTTTVAMDFGTFTLAGDGAVRLLLFGTPGQQRFQFMTEILKGDVDIVVFVVNAEDTEHLAGAAKMYHRLVSGLRVPPVVAVNRCSDVVEARTIAEKIGAEPSTPVVPCQLNEPDSGRKVIVEVLTTLLASMKQQRLNQSDENEAELENSLASQDRP